MKYIRTKDGIYEVEDEILITPYLDMGWEKVFKIVGSNKCIKECNIIKQADTPEELCDGVIEKCISGNRFHTIDMFNKEEAIKVMNMSVNKGFKEFYYGVFIEKNDKIDFISQARLNDKGDVIPLWNKQ